MVLLVQIRPDGVGVCDGGAHEATSHMHTRQDTTVPAVVVGLALSIIYLVA